MNNDTTPEENYHIDYLSAEDGPGEAAARFSIAERDTSAGGGTPEIAVVTGGIQQLAEQLARPSDNVGVGRTTVLETPITDAFGTFHEEKVFPVGCRPLEIIEDDGGAVVIETQIDDKTRKIVEIGRTPTAYDPDKGGQPLPNAGDVGSYLMAIRTLTAGEPPRQGLRYLDAGDLAGVVVKNRDNTTMFGKNPQRGPEGRQIQLPGVVTSVKELR